MDIQLSEIVETSRRVGDTRSRLEKVGRLATLLRAAPPHLVPIAVAYLSGRVRQSRLGIGPSALRRAAATPSAASAELRIAEVDDILQRIADTAGPGSATERNRLLGGLMARATADEQDFLVRLILGELRQGAVEGMMAEAIARAAELPLADVRRALMVAGDLGAVAAAALGEGTAGLGRFTVELFRPLRPMLAQTAEDALDALGKLNRAAFEYKLDGARVQVHKAGDDVCIFSRRLNDVTASVPEIAAAVRRLPADDAILDGEVLALRRDGRPLPFQMTMRRFGRKKDLSAMGEALPLTPFFFDCLRLNGADMLTAPTAERIAALGQAAEGHMLVPRTVTDDSDAARAFVVEALDRGHEGVMAKALEAPYEAGARGGAWLKIKVAKTLDLVVLAAEWGSGRRRGWLSNLHLGARDPENGGYVMLGKTFKGMTDELLTWQTVRLQELEIGRDAYTVYVRPELVVEIAFSDLQESPHYPGGLALRFARVKGYRPDKRAEDADTIATVRAIYARQMGAAVSEGASA